jgi:predicted HNH restriction endonuclease
MNGAKEKYFKKIYDAAIMIECACGCKTLIKSKDKYGRNKKYVSGHNNRKYLDKSQYKREWNHRNRKSRSNYRTERIKKLRAEIIVLKGGKCKICGLMYDGTNGCVFDFHHIHDKKFGINKCNLNRYSKEEIVKESEKCDLCCANCHRVIHAESY